MKNTLKIAIPKPIENAYTEVKASRDVLVHNAGVINDLYLDKAGKLARGETGEALSLNDKYFDEAYLVLKEVVIVVHNLFLERYGDVDPNR